MTIINRPSAFPNGNIYLSGGMQFAKNLGAGWRVEASEKLKEMGLFPLDITELDVAYLKDIGKPATTDMSAAHDISLFKANIRKHFIQTDIDLIELQTDALIVYYDEAARRGAGTVSEAQFAYLHNIPIFLVTTDFSTEREMLDGMSGWLVGLATKSFLSFDDLYAYLEKLPAGILKADERGLHKADGQVLCMLSGELFPEDTSLKNQPRYCPSALERLKEINENTPDRYKFFMDYLTNKYETTFVDTRHSIPKNLL